MTALRRLSRPEGAVPYAVQWHVEDDTATRAEVFAEASADLPAVLAREGWDQLSYPDFTLRSTPEGESYVEARVLVVAANDPATARRARRRRDALRSGGPR